VQSHTVYRALAPQYADKPVFVVGGAEDACRRIAEDYGFKHAYIPADVLAWRPSAWPHHKLTEKEQNYVKSADFSDVEFAAVFVFHDSLDWGRDLQLITDLASSPRAVFGEQSARISPHASPDSVPPHKQVPILFSNPDLTYGTDFPVPRIGQGGFQESVAAVYQRITGRILERTTGGKPTRRTYEFANGLLTDVVKRLNAPLGRVYMVGDNPESDIAGANGFGWESVLVRTGVFRGETNDATHPAKVVSKDVLEGVITALEREGDRVV